MKKQLCRIPLLIIAMIVNAAALEGYYKDVFVDAGVGLDGPPRMRAFEQLNMIQERMDIQSDTALQASIITRNPHDQNGVLLYPDGEPRFAIIFYHGGDGHSKSLAAGGADIIRQHYHNGGSQLGSCGGGYFLARWGIRLWEGKIVSGDTLYNMRPGKSTHYIPPTSPLHKYMKFPANNLVDSIHHNGGGSFILPPGDATYALAPEGTQVLAIHHQVFPKYAGHGAKMVGHGAIWGWKDSKKTGQLAGFTSHPEFSSKQAQINEMAAVLLFVKDGLAPPDVKHALLNNQPISMNKSTGDNDPLHTKIGDLQYHHFKVELPSGATNFKLALNAEDGFDMHLFARKNTFAFGDSAEFSNRTAGSDKVLSIPSLSPGTWYVSVKCATTVTATVDTVGADKDYYHKYSGKLAVLNGVGYTLKATWAEAGVSIRNVSGSGVSEFFTIKKEGVGFLFHANNRLSGHLKITDEMGKICYATKLSRSSGDFSWTPESGGVYSVSIQSGKVIRTERLTVVR